MNGLENYSSRNSNHPLLMNSLVDFYNNKGVEEADKGNFVQALKYFNKVLELDPMNKIALFNRATIEMDIDKLIEAKKDFLKLKIIERYENR